VIGTERHEARRIDNQLRGRSGRQGDPGSSQFFLSLDDDLIRVFGGEKMKQMMQGFHIPEDQPIESKLISSAIASAQGKVEGFNFDARKHLLEYDDVLNKHREVMYKKRREILGKAQEGTLKPQIVEIIEKAGHLQEEYEKKEQELGQENMRQAEKFVCLRVIDSLWIEHLENMEALRDSVRLRAYGQQDPLVEYKNEGHKMFKSLLEGIDVLIAQSIFGVSVTPQQKVGLPAVAPSDSRGAKAGKVGRNDPCPCGSGKKYKKCHGA
jgi:preprotein translocase subunit SecA